MDISMLRRLRLDRNETLIQCSEAMHIAPSTLSKIETGQMSITPYMAKKISNYYRVTIKPVKVIKRFAEYDTKKEPEYKVINRELKKENKELKDEIIALRKQLEGINKILGEAYSNYQFVPKKNRKK